MARETASWISISQAAKILKRSSRQVIRYIEAGLLDWRRIGPRGWYEVAREDVIEMSRRESASAVLQLAARRRKRFLGL